MDRNAFWMARSHRLKKSLSARRAWIEIFVYRMNCHLTESLSARRAWIEIMIHTNVYGGVYVALRKESVDRNLVSDIDYYETRSRSPQGERG